MSSSKKRALDVSVVTDAAAAVDYDGSVAIAQAASDAAAAPEHLLRQQQISLEPVTTVTDRDGKLALEPIDVVPELPNQQQARASERLKAKAAKQQDSEEPRTTTKKKNGGRKLGSNINSSKDEAKEKEREGLGDNGAAAQKEAVQNGTKSIGDLDLRAMAKERDMRSAKAARDLVRATFCRPEHRQIAAGLWLTSIESARSSKPERKTVLLRDIEPLVAVAKMVVSLAVVGAK